MEGGPGMGETHRLLRDLDRRAWGERTSHVGDPALRTSEEK